MHSIDAMVRIDVGTLRKKLGGISQAELGKRVGGVDQSTISRWENGADIPGPALLRLRELNAAADKARAADRRAA